MLPLSLLLIAVATAAAADFTVTPTGPTLEAARDAARQAGPGPHRIVVKPGDYFLAKPVEFDARDNGLTIEAAEPGKSTIYGGRIVTGWKPDGDKFWFAELPGVKEGTWDFRALVVNGRLPERARMPESGTFLHRGKFDVPWLSSVAGGWARVPTQQELTTMEYDPKDLPTTLDVRNAEVRVYHMWDESLSGLSTNDTTAHRLTFAPALRSPAGAFGVKKYVVFNTREGMTKPGQWYLDRTAGRVVYWPLPGEDMAKAKVIAPVVERIIGVMGTNAAPVKNFTLRGLSLQATTTPLKPGGFAAGAYDGALRIDICRDCVFEKLEIAYAGGQALQSRDLFNTRIRDNHIHDIGACGIRSSGTATELANNRVHHVGMYHPSAVAISVHHEMRANDEQGFHLFRNEIHDTPYSGIIGGGGGHLIEENLIYRVMREMQDGGAIYGGMKKSILRGNIVRDVVKMGEGYGVSSYYLDEGAEDSIVERNVSIGVERPTHNHIARNLIIRDNTFIADKDMVLSFQRSGGCTFTGNTLFAPGKINITQPNAITTWSKNILYQSGTIGDAMPPSNPPARRTYAFAVERLATPPKLDGEVGWDEWPHTMLQIERDQSRWNSAGAPIFAKVGYDDKYLYIAVNIAMFEVSKLRKGTTWGEDDGIEISIGSRVFRGFADGSVRDLQGSEVKVVQFAAKAFGTRMGGWRGEWAIPLEALGVTAKPGLKLPANIAVFRAEDRVLRQLEGTLAESWKVADAATLQLK